MSEWGNDVDLLPTFRGFAKGFPAAASWMFSSDIRWTAGFASARTLWLMGLYSMAQRKQQLAFMVTTEEEALRGLASCRPDLLIVTQQLERGSALELVERAPAVVDGLRTILVVDGPVDDLVAAGRSRADAVVREVECLGEGQPLDAMVRTLARGQSYRSPSVLAAMEAAALKRDPCREGLPNLNRRELEIVDLLVEGLGDRQIADRLAISYETARSRGKALRRKLGASTRAQLVATALRLGLSQPGGR